MVVESMMNYEKLKQLNDIHKILGIIIVEGYDERFGFREAVIDKIGQLGKELEDIALLMHKEKEDAYLEAKKKSGSVYGSIVNNTEV